MVNNSTLTPIVAFVKIERQGSTVLDTNERDNDVYITRVSYTLAVNSISEASMSVAYKNNAGLNKLKSLFPDGSDDGVYLSKATITIKGFNTKYSTIKQNIEVFEGTVVGFGQDVSYGNSNYIINMRGAMLQYNQISVISPGLHASSSGSFGVAPLVSTSATLGIVGELTLGAQNHKNGFEFFKSLLKNYSDLVSRTIVEGNYSGRAFQGAIEAFSLGDESASILAEEFDKLVIPDESGITLDIEGDLKEDIAGNIIHKYAANYQMTWWHLLLDTLQQYGLDIIFFGSKIYGIPKVPLASPPTDVNQIAVEDIVRMGNGDRPFFAPSRCILMVNNHFSSTGTTNSESTLQQVAFAPISSELTEQEKATGVFTIVEYAPGIAGYVGRKFGSNFGNVDDQKGAAVMKKGKAAAKQKVKEVQEKVREGKEALNEFYQKYAEYILMRNKFMQRTGNISLRYRPDIIPGLPCRINSPNSIGNFDCYVMAVNHSLDCQGNASFTSVSYNNVRYAGELKPNPFNNPIYPNFDVNSVPGQIKKDFPGIF